MRERMKGEMVLFFLPFFWKLQKIIKKSLSLSIACILMHKMVGFLHGPAITRPRFGPARESLSSSDLLKLSYDSS